MMVFGSVISMIDGISTHLYILSREAGRLVSIGIYQQNLMCMLRTPVTTVIGITNQTGILNVP